MNEEKIINLYSQGNNVLVNNYKHGKKSELPGNLEKSLSLNRELFFREGNWESPSEISPKEKLKIHLNNTIYDLLISSGVKHDVGGTPLSTSTEEKEDNYALKMLRRNSKDVHRITVHLPGDMDDGDAKEMCSYLSQTTREYKNLQILILDQKDTRGIDSLVNFEMIK